VLHDGLAADECARKEDLLLPVWREGEFTKRQKLEEIRARVAQG
jgi:hypothetical protein